MYEILYRSKKTMRDTQTRSNRKDTLKIYLFLNKWVFMRLVRKETVRAIANTKTSHLLSELLMITESDVAVKDKNISILNFKPVFLSIYSFPKIITVK
jgi:hypothetical protein